MVFATEKDCPDLLARLGEESWTASQKHKKKYAYSMVSWVKNRIVTAETCGDMLLLRVSAVLKSCNKDRIEGIMEKVSLREDGEYQYSCRELMSFFLVEITAYLPLDFEQQQAEIKFLFERLDKAAKSSIMKSRYSIIKLRLERMGSAKLPLLRKGVVRWKETQMPYRFSPV